jgi:hypothetical protein
VEGREPTNAKNQTARRVLVLVLRFRNPVSSPPPHIHLRSATGASFFGGFRFHSPADSGISSRVFCSGGTLLVCVRARACPRWWDGNGGWFRGCYGEGVVVGGA